MPNFSTHPGQHVACGFPFRRRGLALVVALAFASAAALSAKHLVTAQEPQPPPAATYDAVATDTARVLAGLDPLEPSRFEAVIKRPSWRAYQQDSDQNWSRLDAERFKAMRAWSDREVKAVIGTCDTLFYPFGGPDFINANVLFPDCSRYLLFGLEPVGSVPAVDRADGQALDTLLGELRTSLSDIFVRDYFITREMMTELKTPGVNGTVPLLLVFLARRDARIIDVRMESPWAESEPPAVLAANQGPGAAAARRPQQRPTAVTIRFSPAGSTRVQTLVYARVRMEDPEFVKQEALLAYLNRHAPYTTLLKSASYLLHDNQFSRVRDAVLNGSRAVLQDDTGVPYRFFDKSAWGVRLFGKYSPPIKDFNYGRQPDLEDAYKNTADVRVLPFSFGYHWREGSSSVMLAVRTESVP